MKIVHVTATFPPYHGGTGVVCFYNSLYMAQRGHEVTVLTAQHPQRSYRYPAELRVEGLPALFRIGNAPFLAGLFTRLRNYDLIHLHYPFIFGQEIVYLLALLEQTRYVITYHQDIIFTGLKDRLVKTHHAMMGSAILARANRLLVTSTDYAQNARIAPIVKHIGARVTELPNGVDPARFHPGVMEGDLRRFYHLKPDDQVILFVGGLDSPHYFKGIDVLLHAVSQITEPNVKLLVIGDGDLRPRYMALADELKIRQQVLFCGHVTDEALPAHYALCELLVLPSTTMGEAFGVVLLEAMSSGKPVIASDLPGVRSVVSDNVDGLLTHVNDAEDLAAKISMLLADPVRRHEMGDRGRAKVESKYAWDRVIDRLERVYQEVLQ